jgi:ATP-dependent DNA helicase DinG
VSESVPDPDSEDYPEVLSREIQELLEITHGRTLVLFTSYSLLEEVLYRVKSSLVNILRQGDADNYRLIEEFKAREDTVLFGTYSFWQGIDIPGEALQCVIITKLPFSVPTEPVVEARMELLAMKGLDPFYYFQVPQAIITFKQGFGRLIRTSTDRGVVAVLDSRVLRRSYGRMFLNSIPEVEFTTDRQRVREFFRYSMVR